MTNVSAWGLVSCTGTGPVDSFCGYRRTTRLRTSFASAELGTRETSGAALCPAQGAHASLKSGSNTHEEQISTRHHAIVSTSDNVGRCKCRPDLQPLAEIGLAGAA